MSEGVVGQVGGSEDEWLGDVMARVLSEGMAGSSEEKVFCWPTLGAFEGTHGCLELLLPDYGDLPVMQIGGGKVEQRFCGLARAAVCGEDVTIADCRYLDKGRCGLTRDGHRCLFFAPGDPTWEAIRGDAAVELGREPMETLAALEWLGLVG